jgi:hypothetical protein
MGAPARAETPPTNSCYQPQRFVPAVGSLPSDAPAFVFIPEQGWTVRPIADYEIVVRDQDQNVVPVTFEAEGRNYLIRPSRPFRGDRLSVRFHNFCPNIPIAVEEVAIDVGPASALPTTIGTGMLREPVAHYSFLPCLPSQVWMQVEVRLSPEMQAYHAVSRWEVSYRGQTRRIGYGEAQTGDGVVYLGLEDVCGVDTRSVGGDVTIAAHVAGASSDPAPLQLTVEALCPDYQSPKPPPSCHPLPPDAGADRPHDTGAARNEDASVSTPTTPAPPPSRSGRGCHVVAPAGAGSTEASGLAWSLVALVVLGARLGRRRRPR